MPSKNKTLSIAADIFHQDIEGSIRKIPLKDIQPADFQPRKNTKVNIEPLAKSLREEGLLQPILVTKADEHYVIIAGERRFLAASFIGWSEIDCKILNKDEKDTYRLAVIENLQREDLAPLEESLAYKKLKNKFSYTDEELSEIVGKSRNYISEILSIAEIPGNTLEKAEEIGIYSKNLLIQLALATKQGREDDFIREYQNKNITSVKSAKEYLKNLKQDISDEKVELDPMVQSSKSLSFTGFDDVPVQDKLWEIDFQRIPEEQRVSIRLKTPPLEGIYSYFSERSLNKLSRRLQKLVLKVFRSEVLKLKKK